MSRKEDPHPSEQRPRPARRRARGQAPREARTFPPRPLPEHDDARELMPDWLRAYLPLLYSTEQRPDPLSVVKYFTPDAGWTWYATEFDGKDTFFGYVEGLDHELGYFSLAELRQIRGPFGLPIERDLWFEPTPLSSLRRPSGSSADDTPAP